MWSGAPLCCRIWRSFRKIKEKIANEGSYEMPCCSDGISRRFCDARSAGLTQLRTDWIARLPKPNGAQDKALDALAEASGKAIDMFAASCPRRAPRLQTATGQFEMMERRMDTAVQAVKTVRSAFVAFYAALDDQQKARVDELGPKRSGWLW